MNKIIALLLLSVVIMLSGCNQTARNFGGTITVDLEPNEKLVNASWKGSSVWYLTRPMKPNEEAEIYRYQEKTTLGISEGTVIFNEHKKEKKIKG